MNARDANVVFDGLVQTLHCVEFKRDLDFSDPSMWRQRLSTEPAVVLTEIAERIRTTVAGL